MSSLPARSLLFVPGSRPDRFPKAAATGADGVIIDLEDAVPPEQKTVARANLKQAFDSADTRLWLVRLNSLATRTGVEDLLAILDLPHRPAGLVLAKAEGPGDIALAASLLQEAGAQLALMPCIESAQGVQNVGLIARASPLVTGLLFGGIDYSADVGAAAKWEPLLLARQMLVMAAAGGLALIDVPYVDYRDADGLATEASRVRSLGFTGKCAIHPDQVAVINRAFTPSDEEVGRAEQIMAAARQHGTGAIALEGKMVDRAVVRHAERVLARAAKA